jgi:hypothetical protein
MGQEIAGGVAEPAELAELAAGGAGRAGDGDGFGEAEREALA